MRHHQQQQRQHSQQHQQQYGNGGATAAANAVREAHLRDQNSKASNEQPRQQHQNIVYPQRMMQSPDNGANVRRLNDAMQTQQQQQQQLQRQQQQQMELHQRRQMLKEQYKAEEQLRQKQKEQLQQQLQQQQLQQEELQRQLQQKNQQQQQRQRHQQPQLTLQTDQQHHPWLQPDQKLQPQSPRNERVYSAQPRSPSSPEHREFMREQYNQMQMQKNKQQSMKMQQKNSGRSPQRANSRQNSPASPSLVERLYLEQELEAARIKKQQQRPQSAFRRASGPLSVNSLNDGGAEDDYYKSGGWLFDFDAAPSWLQSALKLKSRKQQAPRTASPRCGTGASNLDDFFNFSSQKKPTIRDVPNSTAFGSPTLLSQIRKNVLQRQDKRNCDKKERLSDNESEESISSPNDVKRNFIRANERAAAARSRDEEAARRCAKANVARTRSSSQKQIQSYQNFKPFGLKDDWEILASGVWLFDFSLAPAFLQPQLYASLNAKGKNASRQNQRQQNQPELKQQQPQQLQLQQPHQNQAQQQRHQRRQSGHNQPLVGLKCPELSSAELVEAGGWLFDDQMAPQWLKKVLGPSSIGAKKQKQDMHRQQQQKEQQQQQKQRQPQQQLQQQVQQQQQKQRQPQQQPQQQRQQNQQQQLQPQKQNQSALQQRPQSSRSPSPLPQQIYQQQAQNNAKQPQQQKTQRPQSARPQSARQTPAQPKAKEQEQQPQHQQRQQNQQKQKPCQGHGNVQQCAPNCNDERKREAGPRHKHHQH